MKQKNYGVNVGSSSILLIFVLLCLVSFAALSIVSANADAKLNSKVVERTTDYYKACNEAQSSIAGIDQTLRELYASGIGEDAYYAQAGHDISFCFPITDTQSLNVDLSISYPKRKDDTFYTITSWKVLTKDTISFDDSTLNLFDPEADSSPIG
ncbi:MAG: hypothetical protein PHE02_08920 [Lachnospiraceae bacterium]|nr:hypothetical protein [Lachnospiraceae bacterium]